MARPDAPEVLTRELSNRRYRPATIAIGTNTDPYQPIEKSHEIMRACLKVLSDFNHPVGIVTKGPLIERDIDILSDMAARGLVRVGLSVTTLDPELSRKMEPRAPSPARRLKAIERLSAAGISVRIMTSPIVPAINDHEIEALLKAGKGRRRRGGKLGHAAPCRWRCRRCSVNGSRRIFPDRGRAGSWGSCAACMAARITRRNGAAGCGARGPMPR